MTTRRKYGLGLTISRLLAAVMVCLSCGPGRAEEARVWDFDIPQQGVNSALRELAQQTGTQLLFPYLAVTSQEANALSGRYTLAEALQILLRGTGLTGDVTRSGVITISAARAAENQHLERGMERGQHRGILRAVAATIISALAANGASGQEGVDSGTYRATVLEEVIVTASRRSERLQDTAMSISAISGDLIDKRNLVGMDDYLRTMPGVNIMDRGAGRNQINIRGLLADPQSGDSTVGVYFGETPISDLGSPSNDGSAGNADIKLVDIERIEVLRGPQGTLYGSGSMGGTVRIIPASPDLENLEGEVAGRFSATDEDGGENSMLQGVFNLPVADGKLALRGVAYYFENSGYIRNVAASQPILGIPAATAQGGVAEDRDDVGNDEYTGFRLGALWQPFDQFRIEYTYTDQEIDQDGVPEVNTMLTGDFEQSRLNTGPGGSNFEFLNTDIGISNLTLEYDLGWGLLTGTSSWIDYQAALEADISHVLYAPYYAPNAYDQDAYIGEVRLASQLDSRFQWLAGAYYENNERLFLGFWSWSGDPADDPGDFLENEVVDDRDQLSFYGELSYDLTDELKLTVGGRHYDYDRTRLQDASLFGMKVIDNVFIEMNESGELYKVNVAWSPSDDVLVYGEWAEGFRMGQPTTKPNPLCDRNNDGILDDAGFPVPDGVDSDTTENYELGLKTSAFDGRMTFNASVYHIDWTGIPVFIALPSCSDAVLVNAGESKSEGVEIEFHARLWDNVQVDLGMSYNEAELTQDAPGIGNDGDNLPGSPDFQASAGLDYSFDLLGNDAFARIDYAYVGEYFHNVAETGQPSGDYSLIHLKAGTQFDRMYVDLFVSNVTNADDFTWVEGGWLVGRAYRLRPRTFGINLGYRF